MTYPLYHDRRTGKPIYINLEGHVLLAGSTGSGKSVSLLHICNCIATLSNKSDRIIVLDYKNSKDWRELWGEQGYYSVDSAKEGFELAYRTFRRQLEGLEQIGDSIYWLVIDEFASLSESYDNKKERDAFLKKFGEMMRLSRNIGAGAGGWRIIVTVQQADSTLFGGTQARSNFYLRICVGGISSEGKRMLFDKSDNDETEVTSSPPGKGFAQSYGNKVRRIIFPFEQRRGLVFQRVKAKLLH